jgi:hypothetical protein
MCPDGLLACQWVPRLALGIGHTRPGALHQSPLNAGCGRHPGADVTNPEREAAKDPVVCEDVVVVRGRGLRSCGDSDADFWWY